MKKHILLCIVGISYFAHAAIEFRYKEDPYSTHQPILYEIVTQTTGPIIEFGCGYGSTDMLHELCKKNGRILISVDDNYEWLSKFTTKYLGNGYNEDNSGWHKFYFVSGKKNDYDASHWITFLETNEIFKTLNFDVVFVDQSPWMGRYETVMRLKDNARYIILHDCDYFPEHGIFGNVIRKIDRNKRTPGIYDFSTYFSFFKVYFPPAPWAANTGPPTLVASNFESEFPEINYNNY